MCLFNVFSNIFIVYIEVLDYIFIQWLSPEHKRPHNESRERSINSKEYRKHHSNEFVLKFVIYSMIYELINQYEH